MSLLRPYRNHSAVSHAAEAARTPGSACAADPMDSRLRGDRDTLSTLLDRGADGRRAHRVGRTRRRLRSGSDIWAGAVYLLTCGALALAAVGSIVDTRGARAWWLGFTTFGMRSTWPWRFHPTPVALQYAPGYPPTRCSASFASPYLEPGPYSHFRPGLTRSPITPICKPANCLFGLLAGTLGGSLAYALFGASRVDPPPAGAGTRRRRAWPAVVGLAGLVLLATISWSGHGKHRGLWAGEAVLLTWGLLGLTTVAAVCGRKRRRAVWLGATLFGAGYMLLVAGQPLAFVTDASGQPWPQLATNRLLNAARPWLPTDRQRVPARVRWGRLLQRPDRPGARPADPDAVPAGDPPSRRAGVRRDRNAKPGRVRSPDLRQPEGTQGSGKTLESPVTIALEGAPLRTSLGLALDQLSLSYTVKGGALIVNDDYARPGRPRRSVSDNRPVVAGPPRGRGRRHTGRRHSRTARRNIRRSEGVE